MKVGVLGSGDVAKVLASGFLKHGHEVMMGTRTPAKLTDWTKQNPKGRVGSFDDAAKFAELVVLAVKGKAGHRRDQPHRGSPSHERRLEILHHSRRILDGALAARV